MTSEELRAWLDIGGAVAVTRTKAPEQVGYLIERDGFYYLARSRSLSESETRELSAFTAKNVTAIRMASEEEEPDQDDDLYFVSVGRGGV